MLCRSSKYKRESSRPSSGARLLRSTLRPSRELTSSTKHYAFAGERPKDAFKWNQYGFTVGGPVTIPGLYKGTDRLFFMSNFEGFRERRTTRTLYSVPSVKMRGGD